MDYKFIRVTTELRDGIKREATRRGMTMIGLLNIVLKRLTIEEIK